MRSGEGSDESMSVCFLGPHCDGDNLAVGT